MANNFFRKIQEANAPYVIAELGANHNGDMELAKKMIDEACLAGADCVKFQSWTKESIFSKQKYEENYFLADDYRNRSDFNLEEIVERFSVSENQLLEMSRYAKSKGIDFASTPFSKKEVDFLTEKTDAPFIKVASMDINNYPFLDYIARKGLPVVISTGLSELHEFDKAIRTIENAGNHEIIILHCISLYPPDDRDVNLKNIDSLKAIYPDYPIGFSDHTLGYSIPLAAVARGAIVLEKHFTLDKEMFGWDHKVSANPEELKIICTESRRIHTALGSGRFSCPESEERRNEFRRSIVLTRAMKAGETIISGDMDFKRPGTGIKPEEWVYLQGRKVRTDLEFDHIIKWEDLE